jgi:rfaE bifunctional protein nucleotidyltransferase chain/domain
MSTERLAEHLDALRQGEAAPTVALANGCFDLLHVGHVRYLRAASLEADLLVVGVNADATVRASKGPGRPLLPASDRAALVGALEPVDFVTVFDEPTADDLIRRLRPDVHCKGTDYTDGVPEEATVRSVGGRVAIVGDPKDHGTRELIARIRELRS